MNDATQQILRRIPKDTQDQLNMMLNLPIGSPLPKRLIETHEQARELLDAFYPDRKQVVFSTESLAMMCVIAGCGRRPATLKLPADPLERVDAARRLRFSELVEGEIVDVQPEGGDDIVSAAFVRLAPDGRVVVCLEDAAGGGTVTLGASRVIPRAKRDEPAAAGA